MTSSGVVRLGALTGLMVGVLPAVVAAQVVTGSVIDSATKRPLAGVTVIVRDSRDSTLRGSVTDSAGRFSLLLPAPETVTLTVRRIGHHPLTTPPRYVGVDSVRHFRFEMPAVPQLLDTVRTEGAVYLRGMFYKLLAGQEWFAQHMRLGKGFFTSGLEIQLSGMDPCDYLGRLPDFQIASVIPTDGYGIGCHEGSEIPVRYVVPRGGACLQPLVDKKLQLVGVSRSHFLILMPGQSKVRWYPIDGIRGIEIFGKYDDRPKDLSNSAGALVYEPLKDPEASWTSLTPGTSLLSRAAQQRCALMLVWTSNYWGH